MKKSICFVGGSSGILTYGLSTLRFPRNHLPRIWNFLINLPKVLFPKKPGVRKMDFTGKPLKGFVYVSQTKIKTEAGLKKYLESAIAFARSLPEK